MKCRYWSILAGNCSSNRITQIKDPFNDWEGNLKKKSPKPKKKMMCALCVQSARALLAPAASSCASLNPTSLCSTKVVLGLTFSKELLKRAVQIPSFPFLWTWEMGDCLHLMATLKSHLLGSSIASSVVQFIGLAPETQGRCSSAFLCYSLRLDNSQLWRLWIYKEYLFGFSRAKSIQSLRTAS